MITEKMIEAAARAIVGDERYDAMPERATYMQRKTEPNAEWWDREELRDTARAALEAAERAAVSEEPVAWIHHIIEPDGIELSIYSRSGDNPFSHWLESHRSACKYEATPLYTRPLSSPPKAPSKKGEAP